MEIRKRILVLYAELMPYNIPVIKCLTAKGYEVHVVKWDKRRLTPYMPPDIPEVVYYNRSLFTDKALYNLIEHLSPKLIFTCGWMDKGYCKATKFARKAFKIPVIASSDTQWRGGKQWLNVVFSKFRHLKWFDYILVPGNLQFEYARKLGYKSEKILSPSLSANSEVFSSVNIEQKTTTYPKQLLYIGRLSSEKGISDLIKAWSIIENHRGWHLKIIGSGPLKETLEKEASTRADISFQDFVDQEVLVSEMQKSGGFIIPSIFEPWALVIHEAACAGLPILASSACGAISSFLIHNYNGFVFEPNNHKAIKSAILNIINANENFLLSMSYNSRALSQRVKPQHVAATILSII